MAQSGEGMVRARGGAVLAAFALLSAVIVGVAAYPLAGAGAAGTEWVAIAYAAGISMIVLPCTMPLVFIIVPLSMGHGYKKGLAMSLLFGAGLVVTITAYMTAVAAAGQAAGLEDVSSVMFGIAGAIAYAFGLSQLRLIPLRLPTYTGMPSFMQGRGDHAKSFLMGVLLGNAGVGCPNPMFYWLMVYVASAGSIEAGAALGAVHGAGRAVPLVFISVLAALGIDASRRLAASRERIGTATGIMLVVLGAFLIINALPAGHAWYEQTVVHHGWNALIGAAGLPPELVMADHEHDGDASGQEAVPAILAALWAAPALAWLATLKRSRSAEAGGKR